LEKLAEDPRLYSDEWSSLAPLEAAKSIQSTIMEHAKACFKRQSNGTNTFPVNAWFDSECKAQRKVYSSLVRSGADLIDQGEAKRAFRVLIRRKKRAYQKTMALKMVELAHRNPRQSWQRYRLRRKEIVLKDPSIWREYFSTLLGKIPVAASTGPIPDTAFSIWQGQINLHTSHSLNLPLKTQEIAAAIDTLKNHKSGGIDGMKPELLKLGKEVLIIPLTDAFNRLFAKGVYPEEWSRGVIVPCFKQGDPMDCGNYRGITLVPMLDKLYNIILNKRLTDWAEENNIIAACQAGFRKDYRTAIYFSYTGP